MSNLVLTLALIFGFSTRTLRNEAGEHVLLVANPDSEEYG